MAKLGQKFTKHKEEFKVNIILYVNENDVTKAYKSTIINGLPKKILHQISLLECLQNLNFYFKKNN
ncbi:hypothetical protein [Spiroplasma floricola]|uniref:Uncharacterized protein n=1 Tax=Spiroplasma floricola 23-6 TaxID=1336749 RepID=A0A2K8SE66_9MOLU|nr:hypothetical protein [Spiroplasma floricola]AUB31756.1 hypothetical protein SFLOR_v1c07080 [Spiroplasma floricola 23-6]